MHSCLVVFLRAVVRSSEHCFNAVSIFPAPHASAIFCRSFAGTGAVPYGARSDVQRSASCGCSDRKVRYTSKPLPRYPEAETHLQEKRIFRLISFH